MSDPTPPPPTILSVDDPLSGRDVTIAVTLPSSDRPRVERPILVSVGQPGEAPVIQTGTFDELLSLIKLAWLAVAARIETADLDPEGDDKATDPDRDDNDEDAANAADNDDDDTTIAAAPVTLPTEDSVPPQPPIASLSLF